MNSDKYIPNVVLKSLLKYGNQSIMESILTPEQKYDDIDIKHINERNVLLDAFRHQNGHVFLEVCLKSKLVPKHYFHDYNEYGHSIFLLMIKKCTSKLLKLAIKSNKILYSVMNDIPNDKLKLFGWCGSSYISMFSWICRTHETSLISYCLSSNKFSDKNLNSSGNLLKPFHIICSREDSKLIKLFLESKRITDEHINSKDDSGNTALVWTLYGKIFFKSKGEALTMFLESDRISKEYLNNINNKGQSYFSICCRSCDINLCKMILKSSRFSNEMLMRSYKGFTEFQYACMEGNEEVAKLILNSNRFSYDYINKPVGELYPLFFAHYNIISILLDCPRIDNLNRLPYGHDSAFIKVCKNNDDDDNGFIKHFMCSNRISKNHLNTVSLEGNSPFYLTTYGKKNFVKDFLFSNKISKEHINHRNSKDGISVFEECCRQDLPIDNIKMFLNSTKVSHQCLNPPNKNHKSAFYYACKNDNLELAKLLIESDRISNDNVNSYNCCYPIEDLIHNVEFENYRFLLDSNKINTIHLNSCLLQYTSKMKLCVKYSIEQEKLNIPNRILSDSNTYAMLEGYTEVGIYMKFSQSDEVLIPFTQYKDILVKTLRRMIIEYLIKNREVYTSYKGNYPETLCKLRSLKYRSERFKKYQDMLRRNASKRKNNSKKRKVSQIYYSSVDSNLMSKYKSQKYKNLIKKKIQKK